MTGARGTAAGKNKAKALKPAGDRKIGKRKAPVDKSSIRKAKKERRAKKDPNKPKRPPSAFFVFLEQFRATFKKENPNVKAVSAVGKAAGEMWKSMSEEEKGPHEAKARKRKVEYEKQLKVYNKKQENSANGTGDDDEVEAHDEDDEVSGEEGRHQKDNDEEEEEEEKEEEEEDDDEDEDED